MVNNIIDETNSVLDVRGNTDRLGYHMDAVGMLEIKKIVKNNDRDGLKKKNSMDEKRNMLY